VGGRWTDLVNAESASGARGQLFNALVTLAISADAQVAWLKKIGTFPSTDELALEFSDWSEILPQLVDSGVVDSPASIAIQQVGETLDKVQEAGVQAIDDLANSRLWEDVRSAAGKAVVRLLDPLVIVR